MIRVVIVDDQAVVRAGVARILGPADGFEVVAECEDGDEVAKAIEAHHPDVVLMDVRMRRMDGITATRGLRASADGPPVLVLTTFDDDDVLWGAIESGAAGFVLKDATADDIIKAVRIAADGGSWIDPRVAPRVLSALRAARPKPRTSEGDVALAVLSDRELEVLRLIARGSSNTEIAADLFVSERTVKGHIGSIFTKLGARDRSAAIVLAYDAGLVTPGTP